MNRSSPFSRRRQVARSWRIDPSKSKDDSKDHEEEEYNERSDAHFDAQGQLWIGSQRDHINRRGDREAWRSKHSNINK